MDINHAEIEGNVLYEPEARVLPNGTQVCNLVVQTNHSWEDKATKETRAVAEWHRIVAWDQMAPTAARLRKGDRVRVEGRIQTRSWIDANDQRRYRTEIIPDSIAPL